MLRTHAKAVFFTRAVGGMRWRNNMEINAESGLRSGLDRPPELRFANGRAEYGGMEKFGHIPGEPGRKCVRPAKKLRWGSCAAGGNYGHARMAEAPLHP